MVISDLKKGKFYLLVPEKENFYDTGNVKPAHPG